MSNEELNATLEALEHVRKEYLSSPEKALAFMVKAGFYTPDGKLTERYRQDA
jgi:hypothetical protein